jgi:SPOR domain
MGSGRKRDGFVLGLAVVFCLVTLLAGQGCRQRAVPRVPPDIPTTLPSEEEARRIRKENSEAIPIVPQGERELGEADLPPADSVQIMSDITPVQEGEVVTRYGYRVQLFATSNLAQANQKAESYRRIFDEEIYIDFEGLLHKVRVGDCVSRDDADALRLKARRAGCDGAFIVDTRIVVR